MIKSLVEDGQETGNIGIAFAIPINHAGRVATEIIDTGTARRTVIGAEVDRDPLRRWRSQADLDRRGRPGRGGRAAQPATWWCASAPTWSTQPHDLIALVRRYDPGTTVTITYRRGAETQTANVTLVADAN